MAGALQGHSQVPHVGWKLSGRRQLEAHGCFERRRGHVCEPSQLSLGEQSRGGGSAGPARKGLWQRTLCSEEGAIESLRGALSEHCSGRRRAAERAEGRGDEKSMTPPPLGRITQSARLTDAGLRASPGANRPGHPRSPGRPVGPLVTWGGTPADRTDLPGGLLLRGAGASQGPRRRPRRQAAHREAGRHRTAGGRDREEWARSSAQAVVHYGAPLVASRAAEGGSSAERMLHRPAPAR